jgi:hypothetical protein
VDACAQPVANSTITAEAFTKSIDDCLANLNTRYKHQMKTLLNLEFQLFDEDMPVLSA